MITVANVVVGALSVNCYAVYCSETKKGIVIDPGSNLNKIITMIESTGIKLEAVVLTHSHFDHSVHAVDIKNKYNVPIVLYEKEAELLKSPDLNLSTSFTNKPISFIADILVKDGDEIIFGNEKLKVMYTPGHTEGSMSLYADGMVFSGDTLFAGTHGRTDFPTGDRLSLALSLKKLFQLPENTKVYPGHNVFTTIGAEKTGNFMANALIESIPLDY